MNTRYFVLPALAGVIIIGCARSPRSEDLPSQPPKAGSLTQADLVQYVPPLQPFRIGGDVKAPVVVRRAPDLVPPSVQGKRYARGVLIVEMVVDETGAVQDVKVLRGAHGERAEAVAAALRQWEIRPGTLHGVPVPTIFNISTSHFPVEIADPPGEYATLN